MRRRADLVAFLFLALALNYVDRQMPYSMFPALKRDLGFAEWQLGLIGSVFQWVYAASMPFAGRLSDLWRKDRMVAASVVLFSLGTLGCSLSVSVASFIACRAWIAITEAIYFPAAAGMIASVHTGPSRSRALGIHQTAQFLGLFAGGWYGGWMADRGSWRTGFAIAAVAGMLYAPLLLAALPKMEPHSVSAEGRSRGRLSELFRLRCYLALCAAFFFFCAMLWIFYAWYPAFLLERYRLSMADSGWNATLFVQLPCALGVLAGGTVADRLSTRMPAARFYIAALGIVASAPFGYLTFYTHSLAMARFCSAAYGGIAGLMIANVFAAAFDVLDKQNYGVAAGVLNMVGGFSSAGMIFLAGLWKDSVGFAGMLWWVGWACVAAGLALALAGRTLQGKIATAHS